MKCTRPLKGYRSRILSPNGKRPIVFNKSLGFEDMPVELPCGQCIHCKLEKSRQWAMRLVHESKLHDVSCFVTLTYNDNSLPENGTLVKTDITLFLKKLRKHVAKYYNKRIRFYQCGEYGEVCEICGLSQHYCAKKYKHVYRPTIGRPHYHLILFNFKPADLKYYNSVKGNKYYTSTTMEKIWSNGFVVIGDVTFQSASYVSRYVTEKITGDMAEDHYTRVIDGEVVKVLPEFATMSKGQKNSPPPFDKGIGYGYYDKYKDDIYKDDFVIFNGKKVRPPKYYDGKLESDEPDTYKKIKYVRIDNSEKHQEKYPEEYDYCNDRWIVHEKCTESRYNRKKKI